MVVSPPIIWTPVRTHHGDRGGRHGHGEEAVQAAVGDDGVALAELTEDGTGHVDGHTICVYLPGS